MAQLGRQDRCAGKGEPLGSWLLGQQTVWQDHGQVLKQAVLTVVTAATGAVLFAIGPLVVRCGNEVVHPRVNLAIGPEHKREQ